LDIQFAPHLFTRQIPCDGLKAFQSCDTALLPLIDILGFLARGIHFQ
jgi:hypothetical protein